MRPYYPRTLIFFILVAAVLISSETRAQEPEILSLDDAIANTLSNNSGLISSEASMEASMALVKEAKSPYYPEVTSRIIVPFIGRESGFSLEQLIWDFGRTSNRVKARKAELKSSKFEQQITKDDLILSTKVYYYTVLAENHILEAAKLKVEEYERRLEQAEGFHKHGRISDIDLTKSEVNLGNVKLDYIQAKNNLSIAEIDLMTVMGVGGDFNYKLIDDTQYEIVSFEITELVNQAIEQRPDLKSLRALEDASRANLEAAKKEFYPTLFGRAAYRFEGEGAQTPGFIAGVGFRYPIFEGFSKLARVEEQRANLKRTKADFNAAKSNVESEIKKLYLDLSYAIESIYTTQKSKDSAKRSLELAENRFKLGKASEVELAESRSIYTHTLANHMQALYNYKISLAKLRNAIGETGEYDE